MTSDEVDYPPVVRMTDIIDAATDLQFAYERFNKVRGEVFDDLLKAQKRQVELQNEQMRLQNEQMQLKNEQLRLQNAQYKQQNNNYNNFRF